MDGAFSPRSSYIGTLLERLPGGDTAFKGRAGEKMILGRRRRRRRRRRRTDGPDLLESLLTPGRPLSRRPAG